MVTTKILQDSKSDIYLRQITLSDCTNRYVEWLNDPDVNRYLETRWHEQNLSTIKDFVRSQLDNNHSYLFAIVKRDTDKHIGNIKIGPINPYHHHADISYFIGEKNFWGRGLATQSIQLVCKFGFEDLNLHRIEAGAYSSAIGSWKALERNGFKREAIFRRQVISDDKYIDAYRYGVLGDEFKDWSESKIY